MAAGPRDLQALADEFLAACVDALDTIPKFAPGLAGAPERWFTSPGLPVFDCCDQLAVYAQAVNEAATGPGGLAAGDRARSFRVNLVTLVATATRCIPTGAELNLPSITELEASSEQINADGWALWNHIFNLIRADQLFTLCGWVFWDGLRSINPSGGCGGWTLTLRVELEGYEEVIAS